jgi:hypothetical protein
MPCEVDDSQLLDKGTLDLSDGGLVRLTSVSAGVGAAESGKETCTFPYRPSQVCLATAFSRSFL